MTDHDNDGFAAAQDAAAYFGCSAPNEDEYRRIRAEKEDEVAARANDTSSPAETVTLEDGGTKLTLDARVFAELHQAAEAKTWNSILLKSRLNLMATVAAERGLTAVAADLAKFVPTVRVAAMVRRPDGELWRPQVPVSRVPAQATSAAVPNEDDGDDTLADDVASYLDAAAGEEGEARRPGRRRQLPHLRVEDDAVEEVVGG